MSPLDSCRASCPEEVRAVCGAELAGAPGGLRAAPSALRWAGGLRFGDDAWQFLKSCSPLGASGTKPRG